MVNEVVAAFSKLFSQELNNVKLHNGQRKIAENMRKIVSLAVNACVIEKQTFIRITDRKTPEDKVQGTTPVACRKFWSPCTTPLSIAKMF